MTSAEIFVAGEVVVDLVARPDGSYLPVPGGSPANVAVGLARLGAPTQLLARLGGGPFGRLVRAHLAANRVGLHHAVEVTEPTTLAVVDLDADGRASYDFYAEGTADWAWVAEDLPVSLPGDARALVAGSIAVVREPGATALRGLIGRESARGRLSVVLDPNIRPALLGSAQRARRVWRELVAIADVVKVSDEDVAWLEPGTDVVAVARSWAAAGPALVVVTRGEHGAFGFTAGGVTTGVEAPAVQVVDTVGAGDAFTSGLVDSLRLARLLGGRERDRLAGISTAELTTILRRSALVAALTCTRAGADPPRADELARLGLEDRHGLS